MVGGSKIKEDMTLRDVMEKIISEKYIEASKQNKDDECSSLKGS